MPGKPAARELLAATLPLMKAPPVNLGIICKWLDVEVYAMPCDAFGAIFSLHEGKKSILANEKQPPGRFRFSIAHELGHLLLNHKPISITHIIEKRSPRLEREADVFAGELLLPEHLLRADCRTCSGAELARLYKVSRQTLTIRMEELGL